MKKRRYLLEILGLYALVGVMGMVFRAGDWGFIGVLLHPYLAIVALEAIQYGLAQSMLAAVVGCLLYLARLQTAGHSQGGENLWILFGFLATGLILGLAQEARNRRIRELRAELDESRKDRERLRQRISVLSTANEELNDRILGEENTVSSYSEIARRLSVLEEKDLYPAICGLVQDYVHAEETSYYELVGDTLMLKAQKGWSVVDDEAVIIPRGDGMLWTAVTSRGPITPMDFDIPPHMERDPDLSRRFRRLICAPVFHPETHQPIGVVSVDRMPFSRFHGTNVKILGVIARWAGDSLHNAKLFDELRSRAGKV